MSRTTVPKSPASKSAVKVRRCRPADIPGIVACQRAAWADYPPDEQYGERMFRLQMSAFPEGQCLAELDGVIIGYATSVIVQLEDEIETYTYDEISGAGTFSTHDPTGDTLYGVDIAVHPEYRGRGIAGKLYVYRKRLLKRLNLRRMVAFGRIPGYRDAAGKLSAEEYVDQVVRGERKDSALTAHLKAGYRVVTIKLDLMTDGASANWATLLEMPNRSFDPAKRRIAAAPIRSAFAKMRVCTAQYDMKRIASWQEFADHVEFFVDVADEYHCHLLLLPELVTVQLLTTMSEDLPLEQAMSDLADMADKYQELCRRLATRSQIYIAAGTHPVRRDGALYNVAPLFTPSGAMYTQDKLHITPTERSRWGIRPGSGLSVFETPFGRLAILVCYDIEFPELARLLTMAGAELLLVPFSTDDEQAYLRVRYCAHARAVENQVYVVLSGSSGNLPTQTYMLNYSKSAVITPSDFGFPPRAVAAEVEPGAGTVAIADLDFGALAQARDMGSVRPLSDRRLDLYEVAPSFRVQRIRVE